MKLFLYSSYLMEAWHRTALCRLASKGPEELRIAAIENALDVEEGSDDWIGQTRASLPARGDNLDRVDLRAWCDGQPGLRDRLARSDVIWVCGGNGFYLRWILRESGADRIIRELVSGGTVYAGWSAGAVLAGPTLQYFDAVENLEVVPEVLFDALGLTNLVVLPHMDLEGFAESMPPVNARLAQAGFTTVPLNENQALIVDGDGHSVVTGVASDA